MKAFFGRRYMLSASHRLHAPALDAEQNRAAYGKCNNPYGHGHNYIVEVLVAGPVNAETGMVIDLARLDAAMQAEVLDRFDHANLNLDSMFANRVPTTENLSKAVFQLLQEWVAPAELAHVRIEETENNFFEYCGEGSGGSDN